MLFIIWLCKSEQQRSCHEDLTRPHLFLARSVGEGRSAFSYARAPLVKAGVSLTQVLLL